MKNVIIAVAIVVLVGAAFWGGTVYANLGSDNSAPAGMQAGAGFPGGGPMANLTEEEQAQVEGMTDEERRAFFQEKMGDQAPTDAGGARMGRPGGMVEGEAIDLTDDSITVKITDSDSSQTYYITSDTVIASEEGATALASGSKVMVSAQPSTDGVTDATVVVVRK